MCVFCNIIEGTIPSYKVYEDNDIIAILDISQLTKGHTLVIPKRHFTSIYDCDEETLQKLIVVVQKLAIKISEKLEAKGCNILNNNNPEAEQSVDHLHFHIIPRYGDEDCELSAFKPTHPEYDLAEVLNQLK